MSARRRTSATRYDAVVSPRRLVRLLLGLSLALLFCHAALALYHYRVEELHFLTRQLFDVDQENNLPTWYSSFLLFVASLFLWLCARQRKALGMAWSGHWQVLAVGFLLLSIDEVAGIHESINSVIVMTWAIPAGIAALVIGVAFIPFLLHLPRQTRLLFAIAGAMYVGGAAGMEIIGNEMVAQRLCDTLQYKMTTLVEESLEMLGVVLFLHALLRYMQDPSGRVQAVLELS